MTENIRTVAASFDRRAQTYTRIGWHLSCAERLVGLCQLRPGDAVLDAGTGTGFAALAAARLVGGEGRICGVDVSPGMLREARAAVRSAGFRTIELVEGDATQLPHLDDGTFDAITCAAGLLYMPVTRALREWHRLLKRGGVVAFSTMKAGSPAAAHMFRQCAARFGVSLSDPSKPLGSVTACRRVLEAAGFEVADVVDETVEFSEQDLALAWESNATSVSHAEIERLSAGERAALKHAYLDALAREEREHPGVFSQAAILYALGRR